MEETNCEHDFIHLETKYSLDWQVRKHNLVLVYARGTGGSCPGEAERES